MLNLRNPQRQRFGLGIWVKQQGFALSQTANGLETSTPRYPECYWQPLAPTENRTLPDAQWLRAARQRSGFRGTHTAMALPPDRLQRFSFSIPHGLSHRQMQGHIQEQLAPVLPWKLSETLWDYQLVQGRQTNQTPQAASNRPAWLHAALQAQPAQHADVLAMPKQYANECEQWCGRAGLKLVRLEPEWQASMRWQAHLQSSAVAVLQETAMAASSHLSQEELAALFGLALGVLSA
jgi:hypothetical protein